MMNGRSYYLSINLLKYSSHPGTRKFIDVMYNAGVFPMIHKPTRITEDSELIIDMLTKIT